LKFKKGCPRPVCDPCNLPHFGYFPTCWSPWPYPPDWSHCPYPVAAAMLPAPAVPPFTPKLYGVRPEPARTTPRPRERDTRRPPAPRTAPDVDYPETSYPGEEDERPTPSLPEKPQRLHPPAELPGKPSVHLINPPILPPAR
jgi:hypothetical protein